MRNSMTFFYLIFFMGTGLFAQPYAYDFGDTTGSHEADTSTVFLPQPFSGTARVRIGSGEGGFYLHNPGLEYFGSKTELKGLASSTSSANKFSIYNYEGGAVTYIAFLVRFSGGVSGKWYFCAGNGNTYSNNGTFRSDQTFMGLRWTYLEPDSILCEYRKENSWEKLPAIMNSQNYTYFVELYGNNMPDTVYYEKSGKQKLRQNTFDFWVNDTLMGKGLSKSLIADSISINSFMFYGAYSDSNSAVIYLDDIVYSDSIDNEISTLPNEEKSIHRPTGFILEENYPNPFNPSTNIEFILPEDKTLYTVNLRIYDIFGTKVDGIYFGKLKGGNYRYSWYADNRLSSGNYFYRLQVDDVVKTGKMLYIK